LAFFGAWAMDMPLFFEEVAERAAAPRPGADTREGAADPVGPIGPAGPGAGEIRLSAALSPPENALPAIPRRPSALPEDALSSPAPEAVRSAAPLPSMPVMRLPRSGAEGANGRNSEGSFSGTLAGGVDAASFASSSVTGEEGNNDRRHEILHLTRLPVPLLGERRAAHAAALDTPPPPRIRNPGVSPFAPPEQAGVTREAAPDGAPLPLRAAGSDGRPIPSAPPAGSGASAGSAVDSGRSGRISAPPVPNTKPFLSPDSPERKQQDLARREQEVLMLKQQMEARLQDLQSTEKKVQGMLKEAHGVQDQKLKHLISSYTNMKAKQAAQALESLDERLAVKILAGMNPKQAGEVLTYTDPKVVAKLTELLARMQLPGE
jgi:hypothetical protein